MTARHPKHEDTMPDADRHAALVRRYLHLTRTVMPEMARTGRTGWPVHNDHCFQRIVLDTVCGGVWYDVLARPAWRHLSPTHAAQAVKVCEDIVNGRTDLTALNRQSLAWRGKLRTRD